MNTIDIVKSLNIPKEKQLEAVCEFIDQVATSDWWDNNGSEQFDHWAEIMINSFKQDDESED